MDFIKWEEKQKRSVHCTRRTHFQLKCELICSSAHISFYLFLFVLNRSICIGFDLANMRKVCSIVLYACKELLRSKKMLRIADDRRGTTTTNNSRIMNATNLNEKQQSPHTNMWHASYGVYCSCY